MAVQDSQTPRREHQQTRAREENLHQPDGQRSFRAMKSRCDRIDQIRRRQHSGEHQHRGRQSKNSEHRSRNMPRFFLVAFGDQLRIHRNKRSRKHAFAKKIL